jgi:hypothetical protein
VVVEVIRLKRALTSVIRFFQRSIKMFIKTPLILLAFIAVVFSQTDDEESFLFVTKQTVNRFIVQNKELTIKYGLYNSGPT